MVIQFSYHMYNKIVFFTKGGEVMNVNYELKALRARKNISQQEMANLLRMTVSTYNRKENGVRNFTIDEAKLLAGFFKTSIEQIFFIESVTK